MRKNIEESTPDLQDLLCSSLQPRQLPIVQGWTAGLAEDPSVPWTSSTSF